MMTYDVLKDTNLVKLIERVNQNTEGSWETVGQVQALAIPTFYNDQEVGCRVHFYQTLRRDPARDVAIETLLVVAGTFVEGSDLPKHQREQALEALTRLTDVLHAARRRPPGETP